MNKAETANNNKAQSPKNSKTTYGGFYKQGFKKYNEFMVNNLE